MIRTEEKQIGQSMYMVTQLPARQALRMKAKLLKIFGAPFAQLALQDSGQDAGLEFDESGKAFLKINKSDVVKALPLLFAQLDEKTYEALVLELLRGVRKDGMELNEHLIDMEFAGELDSLLKVLWFVIEVNFGSFWKEGGTGSQLKQAISPSSQQSDMKKTSIKT